MVVLQQPIWKQKICIYRIPSNYEIISPHVSGWTSKQTWIFSTLWVAFDSLSAPGGASKLLACLFVPSLSRILGPKNSLAVLRIPAIQNRFIHPLIGRSQMILRNSCLSFRIFPKLDYFRVAPGSSYKWRYVPCKYRLITPVTQPLRPFKGVVTPLITDRGSLCIVNIVNFLTFQSLVFALSPSRVTACIPRHAGEHRWPEVRYECTLKNIPIKHQTWGGMIGRLHGIILSISCAPWMILSFCSINQRGPCHIQQGQNFQWQTVLVGGFNPSETS